MQAFTGALILIVAVIVSAYVLGLKQSVVDETVPEAPGWVRSAPTVQGLTFAYPEHPDGAYLSFASWPPRVEEIDSYVCSEDLGSRLSDGYGSPVGAGERIIGGRTYCMTVWREGAAGSTFATYEFVSDRSDAVLRAVYTVRLPQCANYDEPEQAACRKEQEAFDQAALGFGLVESVRLP